MSGSAHLSLLKDMLSAFSVLVAPARNPRSREPLRARHRPPALSVLLPGVGPLPECQGPTVLGSTTSTESLLWG